MELDENGNPIVKPPATPEETQAMIAAAVDAQLKEIKAKLDKAYLARDEAVSKAAVLEETNKASKIKALEAEGKTLEVANMKIADLEGRLKATGSELVAYKRDGSVRDAIGGLKFRSERAREIAQRDIIDQLQQSEDGQWVHRTGVSIKDYVGVFAKEDANSFLFEPKTNSGSGTGTPGSPSATNKKKPSEMTTQEILAAAQAGQLGSFSM